ncbi:UDP-glucose 4-epimerase GalE [Streptomyces sp. NPDC047042]|uniref:UDP-glucose 4-epimerase GalE n=1 Tax=Streptomyces sp. NPDC047042 TaxID=3154807 RepID=UPI0033DFB11C
MTWLVTGGAGYIGAHVARMLSDDGRSVIILDDLSTGLRNRLPVGMPLVLGSVLDRDLLDRIFTDYSIDGILHLAGKRDPAESYADPLCYYQQNLNGLQTLLKSALEARVRKLVFSSSAAVYGEPDLEFVGENTPCAPLSPYGMTKLAGERLVEYLGNSRGLEYVNLRFFGVAGALAPELGDVGSGNLVQATLDRLTSGRAPVLYGRDYPTHDGTCIRDFIHVADVASAHVAAVRRLEQQPGTGLVLNIGRGTGVSVKEMVDTIQDTIGRSAEPMVMPRRPGDPAQIVACADRIRAELGWESRYDLADIVNSAWDAWRGRNGERS